MSQKPTHSTAARERTDAAAAPAPELTDIAIIGGGASGLAAAIAAARAGAAVQVLEQDAEPALGLLATGNGRCNFSNAHLDARHYRHVNAFRAVAGGEPEHEIQSFFESLGLLAAEEGSGRLYPATRRAESVRDVLIGGCARTSVRLRCGCDVQDARFSEASGRWLLTLGEPVAPLPEQRRRDAHAALRAKRRALKATARGVRQLSARHVIIATGDTSDAVPALFGLPVLPFEAVLCPLACSLSTPGAASAPEDGVMAAPASLDALDGLRVEGAVTLLRDGRVEAREEGEILFRTYGISGIAAFNLSRHAQPGDTLEIDLFPASTEEELLEWLRRREAQLGRADATGPAWFDGMLAPALGALVHSAALGEVAERSAWGSISPLARICMLCKHLPLTVEGTCCPESAQAHRGGVPLDAIELGCFAVLPHIAPRLSVCGAALDMDADCGGFNLSWAWLSGMRAGLSAASSLSPDE